MIPKPSIEVRKAHQTALEMEKLYINDDEQNTAAAAYEQLRKELWTLVFQSAEQIAQQIPNRTMEAMDIVNEWYLDLENDASVSHDFRAHDRVTGFKTISQELRELEEQDNRLAYQLWEREFRKWWLLKRKNEDRIRAGKDPLPLGKKPILPRKITYAVVNERDHDTFGHGAWSEAQDEVETLDQLRERLADIRQDDAHDPENPYEDEQGRRRVAFNRSLFDRHDPKNPKLMYRGQKGVFGGIYEDTDPEPYNGRSSPEGRMQLMRALLRSDNVIDVLQAKGMNRRFKFPADKRAANNAKQLTA